MLKLQLDKPSVEALAEVLHVEFVEDVSDLFD